MDDANKQVAESQAALNQLVLEGKEGTGQYQQAQQALGKDMRFLEFTTRNLALAFTNFIPDVIMLINGVLGLKDRMQHVAQAAPVMGANIARASGQMRLLATETNAANASLTVLNNNVAGAGGVRGALGRIGGFLAGAGLPGVIAAGGLAAGFGVFELFKSGIEAVDKRILESGKNVSDTTLSLADNARSATAAIVDSWRLNDQAVNAFAKNHKTQTDAIITNLNNVGSTAAKTSAVPGGGTTTPSQPRGQTWESIQEGSKVKGVEGDNTIFGPPPKLPSTTPGFSNQASPDYLMKLYGGSPTSKADLPDNVTPDSTVGPSVLRSLGIGQTGSTVAQPSQDFAMLQRQVAEATLTANMRGAVNLGGLGSMPIKGSINREEFVEIQRLLSEISDIEPPKIGEAWKPEDQEKYITNMQKIRDITQDTTEEDRLAEEKRQKLKGGYRRCRKELESI